MIVGFGFTKVHGEKKKPLSGKVEIKNNVSIKDIQVADVSFGKASQKGLKFIFEYKSVYEPGIGEVSLEGDLMFLDDEKKIKEIADGWKKSKKVPEDVLAQVINSVLSKANIECMIIARDLNLPPSIQMPKVQIKK